jgi:predicted DNA-binding protein
MPRPSATTAVRSRQLKLTMTPEMHARLVALAEKLGQTPATLASVALSMHINQVESTLGASQRAVDAVVGQLTPQMFQALEQFDIKLPTLGPGCKNTPDALESGPPGPAGTVGVGS